MIRHQKVTERGFTLVELLIVIVVIAILAAITIVAFNGISRQAKISSAQSAVQQVAKKVASYAITNNEVYPDNLATIGIADDGSTTYQYSVDNSTTPHTYCITVTVTDISFFMSNTQQSPKEGGCPGHGQGGVASVTNLVENPSFEAGGSAVEIRRNLAIRPLGINTSTPPYSFGLFPGRWFGSTSGAGSYSLVTDANDGPSGITQYLRKAWTATPTHNGDTGFNLSTGATVNSDTTGFVVTPGEVYTMSAWIRPASSGSKTGAFQVYFHNSTGLHLSTSSNTSQSFPLNTWTRVSHTFTVPANATSFGAVLDIDSGVAWAVGDTLDATGVLLEKNTGLLPYFDGATSPDAAQTPSWVGIFNASQSILSAPRPNLFTTGSGPNLSYFQSAWAASGVRSVQLRSTYTAADPGSFISVNNLNEKLVVGRTYTASAKVRIEAPLAGALRYERMRLQIRTTGGVIVADSNSPPNVAGEYDVRLTWTHNGNSALRLYHGGIIGSGDVWFDNLMVVEGDYTGPFRDGSSANWIWNGIPNGSTSAGPGQ